MKAIKHSHHEQYLRLANDDAALLVSSGRWVFVSKFEARAATQQPRRAWLRRISTGIWVTLIVIGALVLATAARAADKPVPKAVPYKVCLTQVQARQVYPGQHLKYREVQGERCWFAGKTLPKSAFIVKAHPRAAGAAVKPTRLDTDVQARVQGPVVSITTAGNSTIRTDFTATLVEDAFLALTGKPESSWSFDAYWAEMMGWPR